MDERTVKTRLIHKGRIISLREDDVILSNGVKSKREIVEHPGAVAVIAITDKNELVLVRQFRRSANKVMLEISAGLVHKGESDMAGAKRELLEETGYKAKKMKELFWGYSSPGFCTEKIKFFLATGLTKFKQNMDEDEMIDVVLIPRKKCLDLIKKGEVHDNKSILGLLFASQWKN